MAAKASKNKKGAKAAKQAEQTGQTTIAKARTRDSLQALSKLGELVEGRYRIVSQPPIVVPLGDLEATYGLSADQVERVLHEGPGRGRDMAPVGLSFYADIRGWTLARAHARSGDPIAIAAYLDEGDQFDRSSKASEGDGRRPSSDWDKGGIVGNVASNGRVQLDRNGPPAKVSS